jgi:uncharacterized protein YukJ
MDRAGACYALRAGTASPGRFPAADAALPHTRVVTTRSVSRPNKGIHDIHMMQGNSRSFPLNDPVYGDGAWFIRFRGGETVALFARFTVQDTNTDPRTGAPQSA